ncbi:MAG TPA: CPBP family intramembrane glutamic endopeptidase [Anaerolineae bacterium]|nr:CPBP family intramembrane glutamic endopeptidase [Anaerolineae bacterium]
MKKEKSSTLPYTPAIRTVLAFIWPVLIAVLVPILLFGTSIDATNTAQAPLLTGLGLTSWLIGMRWYGLPALGLRGHRPLYASIGFAVMSWVAFLLVRIGPVANTGINNEGLGRMFIFILLFEAFCVQLWTFGLFFRAVADWRGPLPATISSGILFGLAGFVTFTEAVPTLLCLSFFIVWGIFYGLIRVRTGGIIGMIIVHALQSLTIWHLFLPQIPSAADLQRFYLLTISILLILCWRLWPRREGDYRV